MQKVINEIKKLDIKVLYKKEDIYPYAFDTAPLKKEIETPVCSISKKYERCSKNCDTCK